MISRKIREGLSYCVLQSVRHGFKTSTDVTRHIISITGNEFKKATIHDTLIKLTAEGLLSDYHSVTNTNDNCRRDVQHFNITSEGLEEIKHFQRVFKRVTQGRISLTA